MEIHTSIDPICDPPLSQNSLRTSCVPVPMRARAHQSVRRMLQETNDDGLSITLAPSGAALVQSRLVPYSIVGSRDRLWACNPQLALTCLGHKQLVA